MTHELKHPVSPESGWITMRGIKTHHLKNIDVAFPKEAITIVTGVSGSGKTSLVVDTLLRASQELFLEAMQVDLTSAQRAQLVADLDSIEGVLPCLTGLTPRYERRRGQRVASVSQLLRPLRGLFQSEGQLLCPSCGAQSESSNVEDLVKSVLTERPGHRLMVLARVPIDMSIDELRQAGVLRVEVDGTILRLEELLEDDWHKARRRFLVVDRIRVKAEGRDRLVESMRRAFNESDGVISLRYDDAVELYSRNPWCPKCEQEIASLDATVFDLGKRSSQCGTCDGNGVSQRIVVDKLIDDPSLSLLEGAIGLLLHRSFRDVETKTLKFCREQKIAADKAFDSLSEADQKTIVEGAADRGFGGVSALLLATLRESTSAKVEQLLNDVTVEEVCEACEGTGLSKVLASYRLGKLSLFEWFKRPVSEILEYVAGDLAVQLEVPESSFRKLLLERLTVLEDLGLGHLELRRNLDSMSLGEQQRTRLVSLLSSNLSGLLIVFDEPTTSLHPSEIEPLWQRIEALKAAGNTIVLIEHNRSLWPRADWLIELGPKGGHSGGELLWHGVPRQQDSSVNSALHQRQPTEHLNKGQVLKLSGLTLRNLYDVQLELPMGCLVGVSGVSGSGKTTLAVDGIGESLSTRPEIFDGSLPDSVRIVRDVASGHAYSTSATFTGVLDPIRKWYSTLPESKLRGFTSAYFSYRRREGRCEQCNGSGVESDELERYRVIRRQCRGCDGSRFGRHIESVRYKGASIADVLAMNPKEAYELFEKNRAVADILEQFIRLGLDYLPLGLATSAMSFGERQRLTLIRALSKQAQQPTLFIFDEPTRGLHEDDIHHLISGFSLLIEQGHTVVVVEHNHLILQQCDWHCVMGPGAGPRGGKVIYQGPKWTEARDAQS